MGVLLRGRREILPQLTAASCGVHFDSRRPLLVPENPQMAAARKRRPRGTSWRLQSRPILALGGFLMPRRRGFTHCVSQSQQIIRTGASGLSRHSQLQHLPASRHREPICMRGAQIVTMGLRVGGQRAQHCGGVRVHVRQGSHGLLPAAGSRALTDVSHDLLAYPHQPRIRGTHRQRRSR